jgi:predicted MPP superfamily phosphohydrolase
VAGVLGAGAVEAVLVVRERRGRREPPRGRARIAYRRAVLASAAAGSLCILWGWRVEPYWPEVVRRTVPLAALAPGAAPVRLVHLSDFHCEGTVRCEDALPGLVAAEKPDAIVYTGDSLNEPGGLPVLRRTLSALAAIAPTFVVKGNWDAWYMTEFDRFGGTGVRELDGDAVRLVLRDTPVRFAGVPFGGESGIDAALRGAPSGGPVVFLYHTPDLAYDLARRGVDLCVAGHTHGGQVRLPLYGAILTLSRYGKRFEGGLYGVEGMVLHVTRGIGLEGHLAPRVRFLCRPEIAVLDLVPAGAAPAGR